MKHIALALLGVTLMASCFHDHSDDDYDSHGDSATCAAGEVADDAGTCSAPPSDDTDNADNADSIDDADSTDDDSSSLSPDAVTEIPFDQTGPAQSGEYIATIQTTMGDITLRLFPTKAPKAVENFVTHAKNDYYNGIIFHRVINGFMIQGGDPTGTGTGGESIYGAVFENEVDPELSNIVGALAMANAGPNTNGSQFYINQANNSRGLDGGYTVFGQVLEGQDVVDTIAAVETGPADKPVEDVSIEAVVIKEVE